MLQLLVARCVALANTLQAEGDAVVLLPGLRIAEAGEFTQRAFLNNKIDLAQAEAPSRKARLSGTTRVSLGRDVLDLGELLDLPPGFGRCSISFVHGQVTHPGRSARLGGQVLSSVRPSPRQGP